MDTQKIKDKINNVLLDLRRILKDSPWEKDIEDRANAISTQLDHPCVLTVAGMVKAGKSSFINAFLEGNYAAVSINETTATINFFCYDKNLNSVPDKQKPIQCVYCDEPPKWVSQNFLDSLQGNDVETLNKSMRINRLEFYLDNPALKGIRLVDTPGVGSVTPDDIHDSRTISFIQKLRDKHSHETVEHAETADALIYLISNDMAKEEDYKQITGFLKKFKSHSESESKGVLNNLLIIMGKADMNQKLFGSPEQAQQYLQDVSKQLLDKDICVQVAAVSAGMEAALKRLGKEKLQIMHQELQNMKPVYLKCILTNKEEFLKDSYYSPNTAFTSKIRSEFNDIPWSIVLCIARELYNEKDFDKAYEELERKSGFNLIREILKVKFFERKEQLRYMSQLCNLTDWVYDILYCNIPDRLNIIAARKRKIGEEASTKPQNSRQSLMDEYEELVTESKKYEYIKREIPEYYNKLTEIQRFIEQQHKYFDALNIVKKRPELFTDSERMELEKLFSSEFTTKDYQNLCRGALYWRSENDSDQEERKIFAKIMEDKYRDSLKNLRK